MLRIRNKPAVIAVDDIHKHVTVEALVIAQILVDGLQAKAPEHNSDSTPMTLDRHKMEQELFFLLIAFQLDLHMRFKR